MLRAPMPPSNPVPSAPPARFKENAKHHNTLGERRSPFVDSKMRSISHHHSGSPPHTDVSYVQSSDGTGGTSFSHVFAKYAFLIILCIFRYCFTFGIYLGFIA